MVVDKSIANLLNVMGTFTVESDSSRWPAASPPRLLKSQAYLAMFNTGFTRGGSLVYSASYVPFALGIFPNFSYYSPGSPWLRHWYAMGLVRSNFH